MSNPIDTYWEKRLTELQQVLVKNHFKVSVVATPANAKDLILSEILPSLNPQSISWGGSMTFIETGLYDILKERQDIEVIDSFDKSIGVEAMLARRRQSLLVDLYMTGTNAVTQCGKLVNLDMIGNRVAALTFGPKNVVIVVGRNKIVTDVEDAMARVKNYAAPVNVMRLDKQTPCKKTSFCTDCNSPDRICNTWTITEKSFPKGRIHIVLINQDIGF